MTHHSSHPLPHVMPPEWVTHLRTFVSWPVQDAMVYPENFAAVQSWYLELVLANAEFEPVAVLVNPEQLEAVQALIEEKQAQPDCLPGHEIELLLIPHNDAWIRDNGPTFVRDSAGQLAAVNWQFNAWGGKYSPWDLDDAVAPALLAQYDVARIDAPLVMEGGSLHVDGEGTLLTTEECLLNPNRNPSLSREQIAASLQEYLGVETILWLKRGLAGDETDGHVDNIACFAAPGRVVIQVCEDPADENEAITRENLAILEAATDARGRKLEIVKIPQPPRAEYRGKRLTLSYLNFYFVNGGIILPVFGGAAAGTDEQAATILQDLFPGRRIRRIDGMPIIPEGGNVHCTTQQMPEGIA